MMRACVCDIADLRVVGFRKKHEKALLILSFTLINTKCG